MSAYMIVHVEITAPAAFSGLDPPPLVAPSKPNAAVHPRRTE